MSACESMVGMILASVEGTLDPSSRALLDAHAATCAGCRRALDEQAAVKRMLADLPPIEVSRGFAARIRERVEPRPWWMPAGNWRLWTLRLSPIAALLTIVGWLPLQSDVASTGTVTSETVTAGTVTASAPVGAMESWAAAAFEAGANAAGEGSAVVPQLLDPSVHPHTLLAPPAAQAESSSTTGRTGGTGGSSR